MILEQVKLWLEEWGGYYSRGNGAEAMYKEQSGVCSESENVCYLGYSTVCVSESVSIIKKKTQYW